MSKLAITVFSALLLVSPGVAQTVDKVYLQSGLVLDGYISEQIPGKEITVTTKSGDRTCKWSDIVRTEKIFGENCSGGMAETVTLKSGESIEGRISVQNIGKDLTMETRDGEMRTVSFEDIAEISSDVVGSERQLWEVVPLLDRIILKDSTMVEGFIVTRRIDESVSILQKNRFRPQTYQLSEIVCYQKFRNPAFAGEIQGGVRVVVGGKNIGLAMSDATFDEVRLTLSNTPQIFMEDPVTIEVYALDIEEPVSVYKAKEKFIEEDAETVYVLKMSDKPAAEAVITGRTGEKTVMTVSVKKSGLYFIALDGFGTGIIVELYK